MISNCDFKHDQDTFIHRRWNLKWDYMPQNTIIFWKSHNENPLPFNMQVQEQEYSSNKTIIVGDIKDPLYVNALLEMYLDFGKRNAGIQLSMKF
jgi:hypothetical protein